MSIEIKQGTAAEPLRMERAESVARMVENDFPDSWIEFLKQNNGGVPRAKYFEVGENQKVLTFFLCLDSDYRESPTGETDIGVVWSQIEDRLNEYLVPFAAVFGGDFLCFDFEGEDEEPLDVPKIVVWNHDLSEEDEPVTDFVADDFETFLTMLSEGEE